MQRTPETTLSETNVATTKDKAMGMDKWINVRQKKKRGNKGDSDSSDSSQTQETRRQKTSCCDSYETNKHLAALSKQMENMNKLLYALKEEQNDRFAKVNSDMSEIKSQIADIQKENKETEKEIDFLGRKYAELDKSKKELTAESKSQGSKVKDLIQKNIYLEKYNKALEERIMRLERKELEMQIEINNVQREENEDLMATIKSIASKLKIRTDSIESAWRMPGDNKTARPIVVSLRSREARNEWLKNKKASVTNDDIFTNGNNSRIYINEHITRQTRQLFWSVKNRLKEYFKFIWIQNGKILVKKNENEKKIHQITFESDIENIIKITKEQE